MRQSGDGGSGGALGLVGLALLGMGGLVYADLSGFFEVEEFHYRMAITAVAGIAILAALAMGGAGRRLLSGLAILVLGAIGLFATGAMDTLLDRAGGGTRVVTLPPGDDGAPRICAPANTERVRLGADGFTGTRSLSAEAQIACYEVEIADADFLLAEAYGLGPDAAPGDIGVDTVLTLYRLEDTGPVQLAEDDDGSTRVPLGSLILHAFEPGTYLFEIRPYASPAFGPVTFTLALAGPAHADAPIETVGLETTPLRGTLEEGALGDWYLIDGRTVEDACLSVEVRPEERFDSFIRLFAAGEEMNGLPSVGPQIVADDDGGEGLGSRLTFRPGFEEGGESERYYLLVQEYSGQAGSYRVLSYRTRMDPSVGCTLIPIVPPPAYDDVKIKPEDEGLPAALPAG